jgi:hypothetical protein
MTPIESWVGQPQVQFGIIPTLISGGNPMRFSLSKIKTPFVSSTGKQWPLPKKWHLEAGPSQSGSKVTITPLDTPNSYIIDIESAAIFDLFLVSDDADAVGKYHIAPYQFMPICGGNAIGPLYKAVVPNVASYICLCKPGYFGSQCMYYLPLPQSQAQKTEWLIKINSPTQSDIKILSIDPADFSKIGQAWIYAAITRPMSTPVTSQLLVLDTTLGELRLETPLLDFDPQNHQMNYHLIIQAPSSNTSFMMDYPMTIEAPCTISNCPAEITVAFPSRFAPPQTINLDVYSVSSMPNPEKTTPAGIVPQGSTIKVKIPVLTDATGTITIIVGYYPQSGPGTYLSTPITISTIKVPVPTVETVEEVPIPIDIVARKVFAKLILTPQNAPPSTVEYISSVFTILPSCFAPPSSIEQNADRNNWQNICQNGGTCSSVTKSCSCPSGFGGDTCTTVVDPCPKCNRDHTTSCTANTCTCQSQWGGLTCDLPESCIKDSEKLCVKNNGQLITLDGQCTKNCECFNYWGGKSCEICHLQCNNGGAAFKNCDRCGCAAGFAGSTCDCSSTKGGVLLHAYNDALIVYYDLLANNPSALNTSDYIELISTVKLIEMAISDAFVELLQLQQSSVQVVFRPQISQTNSQKVTQFNLSILYNCQQANFGLGLDQLKAKWEEMSRQLAQHETVKRYFTFYPGFENEVDVEELKPTDPTLPTEEEGLPQNSSILMSSGAVYTLLVAFFIAFIF